MQTATKISALREIRKDAIRADLPHVAAVEAMLRHYGAEPGNGRVLPARKPDAVRNNVMRWMLKDALKGGPMSKRDLVALVMTRRPTLTYAEAQQLTGQALQRMKAKGMVRSVRWGWWGWTGGCGG